MAHAFYPFVDNDGLEDTPTAPVSPAQAGGARGAAPVAASLDRPLGEPQFPARIAVYDDAAVAPRVIVVDPKDVRSYLEEITNEVTRLSILPGGNTIRFADQGPGIKEKDRALEFGTTSATKEMKRYIRGTGSGLPLAQQYLLDKGGTLVIEDNMSRGTVVTISLGESHVTPGIHYAPHVTGDGGLSRPVTGGGGVSPMAGPRVADPRHLTHPTPRVDERGQKIIAYLAQSDSVGPKELVAAYGESNSTWSRALKKLTEAGLVYKEQNGQKYHLTAAAHALL